MINGLLNNEIIKLFDPMICPAADTAKEPGSEPEPWPSSQQDQNAVGLANQGA